MLYQILSPVVATIDGNSFKEAVKNYVKLHHDINLNELIITDQMQHMKAQMKYYKEDTRNKVGINMFPISNYGLPVATDTFRPSNVIVPPNFDANRNSYPFLPVQAPVPALTPAADGLFGISSLTPTSVMSPVLPTFFPTVITYPTY